jgi:predicted phosphodiesterase
LKPITLAVLSDLHAAPKSSDERGTEVKLYSDADGFLTHDNPLSSLFELIKTEKLQADFVVCPGDMTNRADGGALKFVWDQLHKLKTQLNATEVIATVGNHDVASHIEEKGKISHDIGTIPRELLMRLDPRFPMPNDSLADHFWAHGYFLHNIGDTRFLVLNSCWLHEHRTELGRGAVTKYTLEKLRRDLISQSPAAMKIAVCHHHPHVHSELQLGSDDIMINGQEFLDALSNDGPWLVIHGHKHHPKINLAQGEVHQPIVLACGSFSGRLEGPNATVSRNYFHMVEVMPNGVGIGAELRGIVTSWDWLSGFGWQNYGSANAAFPSRLGFGYAGSPAALAQNIAQAMNGEQLVRWNEMITRQPDLANLLPKRLTHVRNILQQQYNISVSCEDNGLPYELGVRT